MITFLFPSFIHLLICNICTHLGLLRNQTVGDYICCAAVWEPFSLKFRFLYI